MRGHPLRLIDPEMLYLAIRHVAGVVPTYDVSVLRVRSAIWIKL